jgi:hypothetical protein
MYKLWGIGAGGPLATVRLCSLFGAIATLISGPPTRAQPAASVAQPSEGQVVDRVVALVEGRMITLSELDFEARVALIQKGGLEATNNPLDDEALKSALELAIGERLETNAADKLQAFPLEEGELESALRGFRSRFVSELEFSKFLDAHEADLQQLSAVLGRRLRAEKILDSKVRLRARVSEAEVRRYYDEHRAELGSTFEEVRSRLREKLIRERYAAAASQELLQIRKGADVRLVAPFARGSQGGAR